MSILSEAEGLYQDLRIARRIQRRQGIALIIVALLLASALGTTAAVFSIFDALVFRPLPVPESENLVSITGLAFDIGNILDGISWWEQARSLESLSYYYAGETAIEGSGGSQWARVSVVSAKFFRVFKIVPLAGRYFLDAAELAGPNRIAVLSFEFSSAYFGDPGFAVGQQLRLNGVPYVIVGVAPERFSFPSGTQAWVPRTAGPGAPLPIDLTSDAGSGRWQPARGSWVGRLRPGTTQAAARTELYSLLKRLHEEYSSKTGMRFGDVVSVVSLPRRLARDYKPATEGLFVASLLLLVVSVINASFFLLGRTAARQKEIAVRQALGARPGRIFRLLLTETVSIVAVTASLALLIALALIAGARKFLPLYLVQLPSLWSLFIVAAHATLWLSLLAAIPMCLLPVSQYLAARVSDVLNDRRRLFATRSGRAVRRILIVSEVSLAFALTVFGFLSISSFLNLTSLDLGFDRRGRMIVPLDFSGPGLSKERFLATQLEILSGVKTIPGVKSAGAVSDLPVLGPEGGYWIRRGETYKFCLATLVAGDYFRSLGIPISAGREFSETDRDSVIIGKSLAEEFWKGGNPLGQDLWIDGEAAPRRVVGLAGDTTPLEFGAGRSLNLYLPYGSSYRGELRVYRMYLTAECGAQCGEYLPRWIRPFVESRGGAVRRIQSLESIVAATMAPTESRAIVLGAYAIVGFAVALAGVFALVSYMSVLRQQEIGIRMALGASPAGIVLLVMREGVVWPFFGVLIGAGLSLAGTRLWQSLLFGIQFLDPATYVLSGFLFMVGCASAALIPALRAALSNPADVLRSG